jgi:hypothetical protein
MKEELEDEIIKVLKIHRRNIRFTQFKVGFLVVAAMALYAYKSFSSVSEDHVITRISIIDSKPLVEVSALVQAAISDPNSDGVILIYDYKGNKKPFEAWAALAGVNGKIFIVNN